MGHSPFVSGKVRGAKTLLSSHKLGEEKNPSQVPWREGECRFQGTNDSPWQSTLIRDLLYTKFCAECFAQRSDINPNSPMKDALFGPPFTEEIEVQRVE